MARELQKKLEEEEAQVHLCHPPPPSPLLVVPVYTLIYPGKIKEHTYTRTRTHTLHTLHTLHMALTRVTLVIM
jgi:hypothetical protein